MSPIQRFLRVVLTAGLMAMAGAAFWVFRFAGSIERQEPAVVPVSDAIIVLTGGADRISDGLDLLEAGKGRRLLISGVNNQVTMEALKRRWPGHDAAFDCCVDLDFRALNTRENARESAAWMQQRGFRSAVIVTASYHMPRARLEFASAMRNVAIHAAPVIPSPERLHRWWVDPVLGRIIVLESIKYAAALVRITILGVVSATSSVNEKALGPGVMLGQNEPS